MTFADGTIPTRSRASPRTTFFALYRFGLRTGRSHIPLLTGL